MVGLRTRRTLCCAACFLESQLHWRSPHARLRLLAPRPRLCYRAAEWPDCLCQKSRALEARSRHQSLQRGNWNLNRATSRVVSKNCPADSVKPRRHAGGTRLTTKNAETRFSSEEPGFSFPCGTDIFDHSQSRLLKNQSVPSRMTVLATVAGTGLSNNFYSALTLRLPPVSRNLPVITAR